MLKISEAVEQFRPAMGSLEDLYQDLHRNPELSRLEKETSATILKQLKSIDADFDITSDIGGHGIAVVFHNGSGPTVLLRADFDALPVEEQTGLPYASTKRMKDKDGNEKPVAYACGHDMHATALVGAAQLLASARERWAGTLVLIFQPAEELGTGAKATVDDGLYKKHGIPIPDVVLAGHVMPMRAGRVGTRSGIMANSADTMHVTLHGRGAHSSMPDKAVNPVVMAANAITKLQNFVSRETDPHDTDVVTVASVHAGDSDNVIADNATMAIDVRNSSPRTRERVLASVKRILRLESEAARAVAEPTIEFTREYPTTINEAEVVKKLSDPFAVHFGAGDHAFSDTISPVGASEDFSILVSSVEKPYCKLSRYSNNRQRSPSSQSLRSLCVRLY